MKYNWEIIGHQKQLLSLEKDYDNGNLAHAYLFCGPENIGKYTVAKRFSEILQCGNGGRCGNCSACMEIDKGCCADVFEIAGKDEDEKENIKIESVRTVLARLYTKPNGRYKILLIKNIEKMTAEASNALLKILEDPPMQTVFLLTTSRLHEVLLTIVSRARLYRFNIMPKDFLLPFLHKLYPQKTDDAIEEAVSFAFGRPGKAVALLNNERLLAFCRDLVSQIETFIADPDPVRRFLFIADIAKNNAAESDGNLFAVKNFLDILQHVMRSQMYTHIDNGDAIKSSKTAQFFAHIKDSNYMLQRNVNLRLVLENLMLAL